MDSEQRHDTKESRVMDIQKLGRWKWCCAIILLLLWPAIGLAANFSSMSAIIDKKVQWSAGMVVAQDGPSDRVTIMVEGKPYNLTDATVIIDRQGKKISIDRLAVPCEARIMYQPLPKGPVVSQITVRRTMPGASAAWPAPPPE